MPRILYELSGCQDSGMDTKAAVPVAVRRRNLRSLPIKAERETEMRKTLRASVLLLALSGSAYAGEIPCDNPTPPQQPTTTSVTQEPTTDGNIPNDVAGSMTQIALDLLAVLPSLL